MLVIQSVEGMSAQVLVELNFELPLYDTGDMVGYKDPADPKDQEFIEAMVVSVELTRAKMKNGTIVNINAYELDNSEFLQQEEIEFKCDPLIITEE